MFNFFKANSKIGLVLSGGGARGFFHIGVIKAIQELKIPISEISGTSIGAIVGAIYASNPDIDFDEIIDDLSMFQVTKMFFSHIDKSSISLLEDKFKEYITARDFKDFKIPFTFNATDINNGKEIIFNRGPIFPQIISSISIPGIFPPFKENDNFYIDGGVINNIPISLIKKSKKIIISDISAPIALIDDKTDNLSVLFSSFTFMQRNNSLEHLPKNKSDMTFLTLNDKKVFLLDFRRKNFQYLIDLGYQEMMKNKGKFI